MKKRRLLAFALAGVMATSNIAWADIPRQTGEVRSTPEASSIKATPSNASRPETATGSNAAPSGEPQKAALQMTRAARIDEPGVKSVDSWDIKEYLKEHPFSTAQSDSWTVKPDAANEVAGKLSDESVKNALNALNFVRYVAGLSEVSNNSTYEGYAQTGTTLLQRVGKMEHKPKQPAGVTKGFYDKGYKGTSSSNLGKGGYGNLANAVITGWMEDGDSGNIDRVGHRRWCLDPYMGETGFGRSGDYYAMYSFDGYNDKWAHVKSNINYVPWPAQTMPINYFHGPWSVSLNSDIYGDYDENNLPPSNVAVKLTNTKTRENWTLDKSCTDKKGKYFNIADTNNCFGPAIVFNPGVQFEDGDEINVQITGLKDVNNNDVTLQYTVNFCTVIPLEKIELPSSAVVNEGLEYQLALRLNPEDATDINISKAQWTSSDETVAKVNGYGIVTGISQGKATITAELEGKTAACEVTVRRVPLENLKIKQESVTIRKNASQTLEAELIPGDATDARIQDIIWRSSDDRIVSVTSSGQITGMSAGTATVTAELNGKKAECQVTVIVPLVRISFGHSGVKNVNKGETSDLTIRPIPEDATDFDINAVTWATSDSGKVTVDHGKLTGVAGGTATVTATYKNLQIHTYVSVVVPLNGIQISPNPAVVGIDEQISLDVLPDPEDATEFNRNNVTWTSSDPTIATVDRGRVTGVKAGTVTVTAAYGEGDSRKTATCQVTVKRIVRLQAIQLNVDSLTMNVGKTYPVTPSLVPADTNNVSLNDIQWTSSEENVATVDSSGTITARNTGYTYISASIGNIRSSSVLVHVTGASSESVSLLADGAVKTIDLKNLNFFKGQNAPESGTLKELPESAKAYFSVLPTQEGTKITFALKPSAEAFQTEIPLALTGSTYQEYNNDFVLRVSGIANISVAKRTPAEIRDFLGSHPFSTSQNDTWTTTPNASREVAGKLDDRSVQNALNTLNFFRFIAGIPSDVSNSAEYEGYAQAGTTLLVRVGQMEHRPAKPAGMSEEFYQKGYKGTSSSNLGWGYANLATAVISGWMDDGDASNIERAGHRRWCLDPRMAATGFGHSGTYTAMYSFDGSGKTAGYNYVPWPAQATPAEYFYGPWSVSLNPQIYTTSDDVKVTMTNQRTGSVYTLDKTNTDKSGKYFNIDDSGRGYGTAIIFEPDVNFSAGDEVSVKITGLKDKYNNELPIEYTVSFFGMEAKALQSLRLNYTSRTLKPDGTFQLRASMVPADASDARLSDVTWSSSNDDVASVDEDGVVTANAIGRARITAELNGKTAVCTVTVNKTGSSGSGGGGGGSSSGGGGGGGGSSSGAKVTSGGPSGNANTSPASLPDYVITGNWSEVNGQWMFRDSSGQDYKNKWGAIHNPYANTAAGQSAFDWFRFDAAGNMMTGWFRDTDGCLYYLNPSSDGTKGRMLTGWVWIPDAQGVQRCYYLNPNSDGYRGRVITNTVVEGYTVNAEGYWVVDGVVQTK